MKKQAANSETTPHFGILICGNPGPYASTRRLNAFLDSLRDLDPNDLGVQWERERVERYLKDPKLRRLRRRLDQQEQEGS